MHALSFACVRFLVAPLALSAAAVAQCEVFAAEGEFTPDKTLFGISVDVQGDRAVVGDYFIEDQPGGTGQVHVYTRTRAGWALETTIVEPLGGNEAFATEFGHSISLDGDRVAVGRPGSHPSLAGGGAVFIFRESGGWHLEAELHASDEMQSDRYGRSVSLQGERAAAIGAGGVYFLERQGGTWSEVQRFALAGAELVSLDGDRALVGAPAAGTGGEAYVLRRDPGGWVLEQTLAPGALELFDDFGAAVALEGDVALVGAGGDDDLAPEAGAAYVYRRGRGGWTVEAKLTFAAGSFDRFGAAVALDGDKALVTAPGWDGAAPWAGGGFLFEHDGAAWVHAGTLLPASAEGFEGFGQCAARDAESAWLGAPWIDAGAVRAFAIGGPDCDADGNPDACEVAHETVRLGSPPNPGAFQPGATHGPVLGETWDPFIEHAAFVPGAVLDFAGITTAPANIVTAFGTLLCDPAPPLVVITAAPGAPLAAAVPADCTLGGMALYSQGGSIDASGVLRLANAIDLVLGF